VVTIRGLTRTRLVRAAGQVAGRITETTTWSRVGVS